MAKKKRPEPKIVIANPEAIETAQWKIAQFYADIYFKHQEEIYENIRKILEEREKKQ